MSCVYIHSLKGLNQVDEATGVKRVVVLMHVNEYKYIALCCRYYTIHNLCACVVAVVMMR